MVRIYRQGGLRDISDIDPPWENPEPVWKDDNGAYTIVRCNTQWDYQLETYFLAHCLGTKNCDEFAKAHVVYSLRDRSGIPHATILCVRPEEYSPYGRCWDIGSYHTFTPEDGERDLRILQVRGRNDELAMLPFHTIVRTWYTSHGGEIGVKLDVLEASVRRFGDTDYDYHFRYLLDEQRNYFQFGYWNTRMREVARLEGLSL